jgi:hypothetical protein
MDGEELEPYDRCRVVCSMAKSCVPVCPRLGREIGKDKGGSDPI